MKLVEEFVQQHKDARILIFGETHTSPQDLHAILAILLGFLKRQRKLAFFMEQFPSKELNSQLEKLIVEKKLTGKEFMSTKFETSEGSKTPAEFWYPEESDKLGNLLQFAQNVAIPVKCHDLDVTEQNKLYKKGARIALAARDRRMVLHLVHAARTAKTDLAVAFVGRLHVAPQAALLRAHLGPGYDKKGEKIVSAAEVAEDQIVTLVPRFVKLHNTPKNVYLYPISGKPADYEFLVPEE